MVYNSREYKNVDFFNGKAPFLKGKDMLARFGLSGILSLVAIVLAGCGGQRKVEVVEKICPVGVSKEGGV